MMDASQTFTTTAIPGADQIGQGMDTAKLAYQNTLTKLNQQRQALARQSGYNVKFDPASGKITSLGVDGTNQFGGYQQTLRGAAMNDRAAQYGAEARGIHGGLAHQAESQSRYGNQLDLTNFGSSVQGGFDNLAGQQQDATTQYNNTLYEQEQQAARDAIIRGLFNQTNYDGIQYDPYGDNTLPDDPTNPNDGHDGGTFTPDSTYNPAAKYSNDAAAYQKKVAAKKAPAVYIHSPGTATTAVNKAINKAKPKPASTKKPKAV